MIEWWNLGRSYRNPIGFYCSVTRMSIKYSVPLRLISSLFSVDLIGGWRFGASVWRGDCFELISQLDAVGNLHTRFYRLGARRFACWSIFQSTRLICIRCILVAVSRSPVCVCVHRRPPTAIYLERHLINGPLAWHVLPSFVDGYRVFPCPR